jgi:hypothetical protein
MCNALPASTAALFRLQCLEFAARIMFLLVPRRLRRICRSATWSQAVAVFGLTLYGGSVRACDGVMM